MLYSKTFTECVIKGKFFPSLSCQAKSNGIQQIAKKEIKFAF